MGKEEKMRKIHSLSRIALGAAILGAGFMNANAADETIRQLAKERGRFIGTILNSEWFNDDIEPEFQEIHKTQFNVVVAENEMKFDATEPKENEFNFEKGDKMTLDQALHYLMVYSANDAAVLIAVLGFIAGRAASESI